MRQCVSETSACCVRACTVRVLRIVRMCVYVPVTRSRRNVIGVDHLVIALPCDHTAFALQVTESAFEIRTAQLKEVYHSTRPTLIP